MTAKPPLVGTSEQDVLDPIAIVGLALQFPGGATDLDSFWDMLIQGRCVSQSPPPERINPQNIPVRQAHFLADDVTAFDAPFFSVSATEAASMDPQQRILLETTYRALENAGISIAKVHGSNTSVYIGCFTDDFKTLYEKDIRDQAAYAATGITTTLNANRISWFFNLLGPSINVDTACSSSLVALDHACQSIWSGASNMSLVGGVNLLLAPDLFHILSGMNMLSPEGRCRSFDAQGNGYGRGEGAGVLVIKRLRDAIRDGDTVRAIIRSTASNQDGYTNGITQPSRRAQERLVNQCYERAGLDKSRTAYVEAHGTGTPVGDPIEATAMGAAFCRGRDREDGPLYMGSVKANIGHLEGASGIAGVIKAVAMLEKGLIPPVADLRVVNPQIDEKYLGIKFPQTVLPWPHRGLRRISMNSFGFGGSNAHAIFDDAYHFLLERSLDGIICSSMAPKETGNLVLPRRVREKICFQSNGYHPSSSLCLFPFSAASSNAVHRVAESYNRFIQQIPGSDQSQSELLRRLAYTLAQKRSLLPWRGFSVIDPHTNLREFELRVSAPLKSSMKPKLAFVFTGQGAQWPGMGIELLQYDVFRESLRQAEIYLRSLGCEWNLIDKLLNISSSQIEEPHFSQTLCTALQVALVDLLAYFNVRPDAVIGHSSGEIAAAYCCGAISRTSAWKIAYLRGIHTSSLYKRSSMERGSMMAVGLSSEETSKFLNEQTQISGSVCISCYNSPSSVTISGDDMAIDSLKVRFDRAGVFVRKLRATAAYHSSHMNLVSSDYLHGLGILEPGDNSLHGPVMFSTVSNSRLQRESLQNPAYWVENMVQPVRFSQAFERLCAKRVVKKIDRSHCGLMKIDTCLEIGPHSALRGPIRDIVTSKEANMEYASALERGSSGVQSIMQAMGRLWCLGHSPHLSRLNGESSNILPLSDLPPYPFDHSESYFHDSRISKSHRLQEHPKTRLLGHRAVDWNPFEPQWRGFLSVADHPWIEHHKINNSVLFPAASMISMAIEAAAEVTSAQGVICGYELRDIKFHAAMTVPEDQSVETQLFLHFDSNTTARNRSWASFRLCAYMRNNWENICTGRVRAEHTSEVSEVDNGQGTAYVLRELQQDIDSVTNTGSPASVDSLYECLRNCGMDYGSLFRNIQSAHVLGNQSAGRVFHCEWPPDADEKKPQSRIAFSGMLDALLQLALVTYTEGGKAMKPTLVPSQIRKAWISSYDEGWADESSVSAVSKITSQTDRGTECEITALSNDGSRVFAQLEGAKMTVVDTVSSPSGSTDRDIPLCWNPVWLPDLDLMDAKELSRYCEAGLPEDDGPTGLHQQLLALQLDCLEYNLVQFGKSAFKLPSHLSRYITWAEEFLKRHGRNVSFCRDHEVNYEARIKEQANYLKHFNAQGKVHAAVAQNMEGILLLETDPLDLLFSSSLLEDLYTEHSKVPGCFGPLQKYLQLFSHKHPNAEYLEIGAGTGGTTMPILTSLSRGTISQSTYALYKRYTFTDISEAFFAPAKGRFSSFPRLEFQRLNIERPGTTQGFSPESYDVIIAANVLHATQDLSTTLRNVHRTLRPGGKLILHEVVKPSLGITAFVMGLLPGWWLSNESFRAQGPCIDVDCWNRILQENGFSGIDHEFRDYRDSQCHELSVLVSTKVQHPGTPSGDFNGIDIITDQANHGATVLADSLQRVLLDTGDLDCKRANLGELRATHTYPESTTIIIDNPDRSLLLNLDGSSLHFLQRQIQLYKRIIWISRTVDDGSGHPSFGMASGLIRSWQTEVEYSKVLRIGLSTYQGSPAENLHAVRDIIVRFCQGDDENFELEYEEHDGLMNVCRLQIDNDCRNAISDSPADEVPQQTTWQAPPPLRLITETPGLLESLIFVEDSLHSQNLAADEVEIEVRSIGLNFKDCLIALGRVPGQHLGNECAGVVRAVGSACAGHFELGDRVSMSTTESFKTYARSKAQCVCRIPPSMSFDEAASIPTQFVTAWTCLHDIARLTKGETVLIHAGAGGTGQAAIQISQYLGAQVIVTVGSKQKKELLVSEYGIPEDHILYSRDCSFSTAVKRITRGRGVDVVLNSLAGDGLFASWESLAPYGRFIEIGKTDILANSNLPMFPFNKGVTFSAFDGSMWMVERPHEAQRNIQIIMDLFAGGHMHTARPLNIYDIKDVKSAFSTLAHGKSSGKHVVQVSPTAEVKARIQKPAYTLLNDATYVIAGGFGGIGRTIAKWMVDKGARYLIILSRSGLRSPASRELVEALQGAGATVQAPACDISDEAELRRVLSDCGKVMPAIRGCVHASMVLRDVVFGQMTHAQWVDSTAPKVSGSWNLHQVLPETLGFFILLSSVSGIIGHRGQSNYAAGNTFQDALAHYRISKGQKAISINLGAMVDDGYLAEVGNKHIRERLLSAGAMQPITRQDLFSLLERYCNPSLDILALSACQVACGINTPRDLHAKGLDEPTWLQRSMFSTLYWAPSTTMTSTNGGMHGQENVRDYRQAFIEAASSSEAGQVVAEALVAKIARGISRVTTGDSEIDASQPIVAYGVDSLLAVDLRGWLRKIFQADVPTFEILGGTSFVAMGPTVVNRSRLRKEGNLNPVKMTH